MEHIGIIHTPYKTKEECPIQPLYSLGSFGRVEVFREYELGLRDVETFSHIYLLYLFDRAGKIDLVRGIHHVVFMHRDTLAGRMESVFP